MSITECLCSYHFPSWTTYHYHQVVFLLIFILLFLQSSGYSKNVTGPVSSLVSVGGPSSCTKPGITLIDFFFIQPHEQIEKAPVVHCQAMTVADWLQSLLSRWRLQFLDQRVSSNRLPKGHSLVEFLLVHRSVYGQLK